METGEKAELGTLGAVMNREWSVVRIFGPNCLGSVAAMVEAGAVMYCPLIRIRKRVGRMRSLRVEVSSPAYPGWAFMLGEPDPAKLKPWLRFRALDLKISHNEIDAVREEEKLWNLKALEVEHSQKAREYWEAGVEVEVVAGLLKGQKMIVEKDLGNKINVRWPGRNTSAIVTFTPFLLKKVGA